MKGDSNNVHSIPNYHPPSRMSQPFPEEWTDDVCLAAWKASLEAYPNEVAGIVKNGQYIPLENISKTPKNDVYLSNEDLLRIDGADVFFHSHPNGNACPSEADMIYQQQLGIPFVIINLPNFEIYAFGDTLPRSPLELRGFRHGIHDCYTLMRDWYKIHMGLDFDNKPRDWQWWTTKNRNFYMEYFTELGFKSISKDEAIQKGDILLMRLGNPVPMHGGVVVRDDLVYHHMAGSKPSDHTRLSGNVPRHRIIRHCSFALRYDK